MKPAVLILVEEALEAGLTHVVIVVSPHHLSDFRAIFEDGVSPAELARLPPRMRSYSHKIKEMGTRVTLHVQARQLGLGHAVLDARSALKVKFLTRPSLFPTPPSRNVIPPPSPPPRPPLCT